MAKFWLTQRTTVPTSEEDSWRTRVYNMEDVEVLIDQGLRMKVEAGDEIALRMMCGDQTRIERA
jgi:hypothetical protein